MKTYLLGTKGEAKEIHRIQYVLSGHNVFQHRSYWAKPEERLDRVFDALMGIAAKNMKWWLGYPLKDCTSVYGPMLDNYLVGKKKLSPAMHARRIARKFEKKPTPPPVVMKYISPIAFGHKWVFLGGPGVGTHSWSAPPNNWQSDNARDYGCPVGTPLVAVADGKIGQSLGPISKDGGRFSGLRFYLETDDGNQFYYAHCSEILVKVGQKVKKGSIVAKSGEASGVAHLHIGEMRGNPIHDLS